MKASPSQRGSCTLITTFLFSALTLLYQVSSQWGSLLLNFQQDSSYQWCPILMIHTTRWLFLSGNFLLPHRLEAVGKGRHLVAGRIVSDGLEKGSKITALSPKSLADTDTLKATTQDLGIVGPKTNLIQHPDAQSFKSWEPLMWWRWRSRMCGGGICISAIINDDSSMTEDCTFFFLPNS